MAVDPFEALISESNSMNRKIQKEEAAKKQGLHLPDDYYDDDEDEEDDGDDVVPEKRVRNKREFPSAATIDPYDPSTYGYTELGTIIGAHGVYGLCKLSAVTGFPERLCQPGIRHLKAPNRRSPREIRLMEGRVRLGDEYLVKFEGVGDRDGASRLRGSVLYARQEERPEDLGEDEYLVTDLVGLDVNLVTGYGEDSDGDTGNRNDEDNEDDDNKDSENDDEKQKGKFVGTVRGIILAEEMCSIPGLGDDMLEIVLPRGKNGTPSWRDEMVLVPIVPSIVPTVDLERSVIYIDPPGGLLDLTYVQEEKVRIKAFLPPAKDP